MLRLISSLLLTGVFATGPESTLDASTFTKLVLEGEKSDDKRLISNTYVVHMKKKYDYDQMDLTPKTNNALLAERNVIVLNLELDTDPADKEDEEALEAYRETEEYKQENENWFIEQQERRFKKRDMNLLSRLGLTSEDLPMLAVFKNGNLIGSKKIVRKEGEDTPSSEDREEAETTTIEDVGDFLSNQASIELNFDSLNAADDDAIEGLEGGLLPSEFLDQFLKVSTGLKSGVETGEDVAKDVDSLLQEAKSLLASETDDVEDTENSGMKRKILESQMWLKVLKKVGESAKKDASTGAKAYIDKELKRVTGMLSTNSLTKTKEMEMKAKVKCLKTVEKKMKKLESPEPVVMTQL